MVNRYLYGQLDLTMNLFLIISCCIYVCSAKGIGSSNEWYKQFVWQGKCDKIRQCWWCSSVCSSFSLPFLVKRFDTYACCMFVGWSNEIGLQCSETFPSGCLTLDFALGGGLPKGRVVEVNIIAFLLWLLIIRSSNSLY